MSDFYMFLLEYSVLTIPTFIVYHRYKKKRNIYLQIPINLSYEQILDKIFQSYGRKSTYIISKQISEIGYHSSKGLLIIPEKYKQPSLESISQIFRELNGLEAKSSRVLYHQIRSLIYRMQFYFLHFCAFVYTLALLMTNPLNIILPLYIFPAIIILIFSILNKRNLEQFSHYLNLFLPGRDQLLDRKLLLFTYMQPGTLMATAFSKHIEVVKWLFTNSKD